MFGAKLAGAKGVADAGFLRYEVIEEGLLLSEFFGLLVGLAECGGGRVKVGGCAVASRSGQRFALLKRQQGDGDWGSTVSGRLKERKG
jgi:hypothetical protein